MIITRNSYIKKKIQEAFFDSKNNRSIKMIIRDEKDFSIIQDVLFELNAFWYPSNPLWKKEYTALDGKYLIVQPTDNDFCEILTTSNHNLFAMKNAKFVNL